MCAGLLDLDPGLPGEQRHDSAREVALDVIGRGDALPGRDEDLDAALLRVERDQARAVARVLAHELAQLSAVAGDESRLLATPPLWVNDRDG